MHPFSEMRRLNKLCGIICVMAYLCEDNINIFMELARQKPIYQKLVEKEGVEKAEEATKGCYNTWGKWLNHWYKNKDDAFIAICYYVLGRMDYYNLLEFNAEAINNSKDFEIEKERIFKEAEEIYPKNMGLVMEKLDVSKEKLISINSELVDIIEKSSK